jgi:beta-lactamase regulating signal transducer with metallopeptidase domain
VAGAYLLFVLARAVRLATAWRRTRRLIRRAEAAPATLARPLADCAVAFGRDPEVRVSSEIAAPMTFGLRRPLIVLPSRFAGSAVADALRGALAHELSHVVRHDCAVNLACELLALPVSFHPVVRFLKRRLGGAREAACDEAAAAFVGSRPYARTLLEVAAGSCRPVRLAGALGALDGDSLEDRVKRILDGRRSMGSARATLVLGALVLSLAQAGRLAGAAAVGVNTEAGPSDMVGRWTATIPEGRAMGQPAADLTIALTPNGPDIALTL